MWLSENNAHIQVRTWHFSHLLWTKLLFLMKLACSDKCSTKILRVSSGHHKSRLQFVLPQHETINDNIAPNWNESNDDNWWPSVANSWLVPVQSFFVNSPASQRRAMALFLLPPEKASGNWKTGNRSFAFKAHFSSTHCFTSTFFLSLWD